MRKRCGVWLLAIVLSAVCAAAQRGSEGTDQYLGTWTGTWDAGASGGGFEVTFEKGTDGALTGRVSVTGEPTYKAAFRTLSFDGKKMNAKYDFTPDPQGEVVLEATFEGNTAAGTWSLRAKANDAEVARGGWKVTKKQAPGP
jgi:opacity protein-like surface antigen